jgi:hypothetical protein
VHQLYLVRAFDCILTSQQLVIPREEDGGNYNEMNSLLMKLTFNRFLQLVFLARFVRKRGWELELEQYDASHSGADAQYTQNNS